MLSVDSHQQVMVSFSACWKNIKRLLSHDPVIHVSMSYIGISNCMQKANILCRNILNMSLICTCQVIHKNYYICKQISNVNSQHIRRSLTYLMPWYSMWFCWHIYVTVVCLWLRMEMSYIWISIEYKALRLCMEKSSPCCGYAPVKFIYENRLHMLTSFESNIDDI